MKNVLIVIVFCFVAFWLIPNAIVYNGVPMTWTIGHKVVEDSTVFTGKYIQVNKNIKIIAEEDDISPRWNKYILLERVDGEWKRVGECWTHWSIHGTKWGVLDYMRWKYNKEKRKEARIKNSHF